MNGISRAENSPPNSPGNMTRFSPTPNMTRFSPTPNMTRFSPTPNMTRAAGNGTLSPNNFLTYENPTYGIKMQYPSDWNKNTTIDNSRFGAIASFYSPGSGAVILAIHTQGKTHQTLQEYLDRTINSHKDLTGFKVIEANTDATLSNQSAYLFVSTLTGSPGHSTQQVREVGTIIGDRLYTITYFVDEADYYTYLPTVDKMIDSYAITTH
jgi:hypothetical protein